MTAADLTLSDAAALGRLRVEVAQACRVPAAEGLVSDVLGHVSVRVGPDHMLIRSRSPLDPGLLLSRPEDVVLTDLDGNPVEELGDRALPQELPTHAEVLRARPDDGAVVHAHPPDVVLCSIAGLELLPIDGAFSIPAMRLAERGSPSSTTTAWSRVVRGPRSWCRRCQRREAVVLRGHGLTTAGSTIAGHDRRCRHHRVAGRSPRA